MLNLEMSKTKMLVDKALAAMDKAYSPYSDFCVGAALLCDDGEIFTGVNVENSSFGATICAERSAFCSAISAGKRNFAAIAIVGAPKGKAPAELCTPCGICRQFISEFCSADFQILLYDGQAVVSKTLGELLPEAFKL